MELSNTELATLGIPIKILNLSSENLEELKNLYGRDYYPLSPHKYVEHLATMFLQVDTDSCMDVGADDSPYFRLFNGWRQDLCYPVGVNVSHKLIGSDAGTIPVADESFEVLTLHCAFEHFEGDADIAFLQEAERILTIDGSVYICPLYTWDKYTEVPPQPSPNKGFGRFYDLDALNARVIKSNNLSPIIYNVYLDNVYQFRLLQLRKDI